MIDQDESIFEDHDNLNEDLDMPVDRDNENNGEQFDTNIAPSLPSRVLDDALHFMDHLLRLLPKMHYAFDAFCSDFSRAIFLHDKNEEANVCCVLKEKGVDWEYAQRAKSNVLNHQIWRLIPAPEDIVP